MLYALREANVPKRTDPPARQLVFHFQDRARDKGFENASALAAAMFAARQSAYGYWDGRYTSISLDIYARLCRTLDVAPGDWFRWGAYTRPTKSNGEVIDQVAGVDIPDWQVLEWDMKRQIDRMGGPVDFAFRSRLYDNTINPIYEGTAQSVFLDTLARLALPFARRPFNLGGLLVWRDDLEAGRVNQVSEAEPTEAAV
jgi:hypothetical protein